MKEIIIYLLLVVFAWCAFSLLASVTTMEHGLCNKTFPINYIFYSKLFCEIGGDDAK